MKIKLQLPLHYCEVLCLFHRDLKFLFSGTLSMTAISSITATSSHQSHIVDLHSSLQADSSHSCGNHQKDQGNRNNVEDQPTVSSSHTNCNMDVDLHSDVSQVSGEGNEMCNRHTSRKWDYAWTVQHFSVKECPTNWHHALTLLLEYSKNMTEFPESPLHDHAKVDMHSDNCDDASTQETSSSGSRQLRRVLKKDFSQCTFTPVPISLPLNCKNQHKHKWAVAKGGKKNLTILVEITALINCEAFPVVVYVGNAWTQVLTGY